VRRVVAPERVYIASFGSQQGNRHVHWHVTPLPPGVPYNDQQLRALMFETRGVLELSNDEMVELASRIRSELGRERGRLAVLLRPPFTLIPDVLTGPLGNALIHEPALLHHPSRIPVVGSGETHDSSEPDPVERIIERRARRHSREAVAPRLASDRPADLILRRAAAPARFVHHADATD
jgi:hypothetical protein